MTSRSRHPRLTVNVIAAAKPAAKEYILWDGALAHFGVRVHPSGVRSFVVQTRARGRMRKITLGRFPEMGIEKARREAAAVLALLWGGEAVASPRKTKAPLFRDFAARYRERRKSRWKPSSLRTHDIYMKNRLIPRFGRLRLDAITHARVSAWFDAASADRPGAANRAFEILRAMLAAARQWGEIGEHVPDACANIVKNPRRPVARYLDRAELERLGTVLDRHREQHPWPVAAIRLLTLTGARLSEVVNLKWDEIGELGEDGTSARLEDSKTGPRTVWLGPEAARLLAALPPAACRGAGFPRGSDVSAALHVLVRHSRRSRTARLPHPRLPAHLGIAGRHERRRADHRRAAARTPPARDHRHLCPSRRCRATPCRRANGSGHRQRHGIQGRAAAFDGRGGRRGCPRSCPGVSETQNADGTGRAANSPLAQVEGHQAIGRHGGGRRYGGASPTPGPGLVVTPTPIARCRDGKSGYMEPSAPQDPLSY